MRPKLRDYADLGTVISTLIALSSAGFVALVTQYAGKVFLDLSTFERVVLGLCLFGVVLAILLTGLKRVRESRARQKSELERMSRELEEAQIRIEDIERERDRLGSELQAAQRERDELAAENEGIRDRPDDQTLKQEARRVSDELFRFADERDLYDPQNAPDFPKFIPEDQRGWELSQAKTAYDDDTVRQYHQHYESDVRAVLEALERREWCNAEVRKEIETAFVQGLMSTPTQRMRRGAARIAAFGKRL